MAVTIKRILVLVLSTIVLLIVFNEFRIKPPVSQVENMSPFSQVEMLTDCQLYYRDIFRNAPVYGRFEEYPVTTTYTGPIAPLDEESHPLAAEFRSYHTEALSGGSTFASRYAVSEWGFTALGEGFALIDVETGAVYPFPYIVDWDVAYQIDSNLIIINPIETMPRFDELGPDSDTSCEVKWYNDMKTYYFVFENNEFRLLGPEDTSGLQASTWVSEE